MVKRSPNIQIISSSSNLKLALLHLPEFASFCGVKAKREIEKKAASYMVRQVLGEDNAAIQYKESGKPYLLNGTKISVSHAYDKLAILFSLNGIDVGVDVEKVRDKILKIKEKFLSQDELKVLESASLEMYTLYWAVKEAIYKAADTAGLLFAEQIAVEPFTFNNEGGKVTARIKRLGSEKKFDLRYEILDEYVLVYTEN